MDGSLRVVKIISSSLYQRHSQNGNGMTCCLRARVLHVFNVSQGGSNVARDSVRQSIALHVGGRSRTLLACVACT